MVLIAVKAVPAGSRPQAADDSMRTSTGERCGFGASAPSLTKELKMHFSGARGGWAILPKLVKLVGPSSTLLAEELSPICLARSAAVASSVRLQVFLSVCTSASVARRGCQELHAQGLLNADLRSSSWGIIPA